MTIGDKPGCCFLSAYPPGVRVRSLPLAAALQVVSPFCAPVQPLMFPLTPRGFTDPVATIKEGLFFPAIECLGGIHNLAVVHFVFAHESLFLLLLLMNKTSVKRRYHVR